VNQNVWAHEPPPRPGAEPTGLLRATLKDAAEITALRRQLRDRVWQGAGGQDADEVDRLLLVFEELASNGVRHGRGPVTVSVVDTGTGWLLQVQDADGGRAPSPAVGRDPAKGGLGLVLVSRLAAGHGWVRDERGGKTVWACVEYRTTKLSLPQVIWRGRGGGRHDRQAEGAR
jgi:two-component sensor histidine kinase